MNNCLHNDLKQRLNQVQERIEKACQSVNRKRDDVNLVVVTKRRSAALIGALIPLGVKNIGENYVQELLDKQASLGEAGKKFSWHLIGTLQRRKAKYLPHRIAMIHSIDRLKAAQKLDSVFSEELMPLPAFLQVNLSGEDTKSGWTLTDGKLEHQFLSEVERMLALQNLKIKGLMTMPPYSSNSESSRRYYVQLRKLAERLNHHFQNDLFTDFSIGTSFDYEVAIQEGATYVRIGEAILGPREQHV